MPKDAKMCISRGEKRKRSKIKLISIKRKILSKKTKIIKTTRPTKELTVQKETIRTPVHSGIGPIL